MSRYSTSSLPRPASGWRRAASKSGEEKSEAAVGVYPGVPYESGDGWEMRAESEEEKYVVGEGDDVDEEDEADEDEAEG